MGISIDFIRFFEGSRVGRGLFQKGGPFFFWSDRCIPIFVLRLFTEYTLRIFLHMKYKSYLKYKVQSLFFAVWLGTPSWTLKVACYRHWGGQGPASICGCHRCCGYSNSTDMYGCCTWLGTIVVDFFSQDSHKDSCFWSTVHCVYRVQGGTPPPESTFICNWKREEEAFQCSSPLTANL